MPLPLLITRLLRFVAIATLMASAGLSHGLAQDAKPAAPDAEAKLIATLTNAKLDGRWAPLKDGQLGSEKEDAYQIASMQKIEGDRWELKARVQYQGQSVDVPVPAVVKWAGDTVVLLFDNVNIGTPRLYTARLMIHGDAYSGTWSGGDHGGMLYGVIKHPAN